jgi:hypothetical protein
MWFPFLRRRLPHRLLSILENEGDSGRRFAMTLHRMFLFLHNMAGEDTDVLKDTFRNDEQKAASSLRENPG